MAVDMFLKIGDIKGESKDKAHADEIDVLAWSWGLTQSGAPKNGGRAGGGKVDVHELSFTKQVDKASTNLLLFCSTGKRAPEAKLTVRKSGENPLEYLVVTLKDVMITSVSTGGSEGQERLTENVTLAFGKVQVDYQPQKADGSKDGGALQYGWDAVANAKI